MAMWRKSCGWCVPMLAWALPETLLWTGAMPRWNWNPQPPLLFASTAQKARVSFRQGVGFSRLLTVLNFTQSPIGMS